MQKINCTNDYNCFIYMDVVDNKDILIIDFNITSYKVCKQGWHTYDFPSGLIINDKLFLDEKTMMKVIEVLDVFIRTGEMNDDLMNTTERGFSYLELKDIKGNTISIQKSSAALEDKLWFGCSINEKTDIFVETNGEVENFKYPYESILLEDRLHLNKKLAKQLKKSILCEWQANQLSKDIVKTENLKPGIKI